MGAGDRLLWETVCSCGEFSRLSGSQSRACTLACEHGGLIVLREVA
jgi:hypothetical protein